MRFTDILYGRIEIPDDIGPFLKIPEFARLRGVGLSNVDSYEFKDFAGPSRWEHGLAVASLALRCAAAKGLDRTQTLQLALAGLLHDVATPPFGHTGEYVLVDFDHEAETQNILGGGLSRDSTPGLPIFQGQLPRFRLECERLASRLKLRIDPDEVARMVVGEGQLGYLISGPLDLDNADNVTRACLYLGLNVSRQLPIALAEWLGRREGPPLDLESIEDPEVRTWIEYRRWLYQAFYESSDEELGRQAFLQHLMRRALAENVPRRSVVWNTDEGLLSLMEESGSKPGVDGSTLRDLVQKYRLLSAPTRVLSIPIDDEDVFRALRLPRAAAWIEDQLSIAGTQMFVMVSARRWGQSDQMQVTAAPGAVGVFKLGSSLLYKQLPDWLKSEVAPTAGVQLTRAVTAILRRAIQRWSHDRPWLAANERDKTNARQALDNVGDWTFRLSRNDNFHAYPSTFVHAIPACLINALGLRGELIVDPFGGTGQTAAEAIRYGGSAVTADVSTIATLVAQARFRYLSPERRAYLKALSLEQVPLLSAEFAPEFPLRAKWHHPRTVAELASLRCFIQSLPDGDIVPFLTATLSAVLPATTARRGREHGWFADNTPLPRGQIAPDYVDAMKVFFDRLTGNLTRLERYYSQLEKSGRDVENELARVRVVRLDAGGAGLEQYGIAQSEAAAIVTSPPYLCMADYVLGSRLSYYWLLDEAALGSDFGAEMGARRRRFRPEEALADYMGEMTRFAEKARQMVRPGGYLAMVLGMPSAKAFENEDVLGSVDRILKESGFDLFWSKWRKIQWHRNHGYQKLREERVAVYS